jgi:hypothetical protein
MCPPILCCRLEADLTLCVDAQSIDQADVRFWDQVDGV